MIPFGGMVEYCLLSARDQSRLHQFGKNVFLTLLGYVFIRGTPHVLHLILKADWTHVKHFLPLHGELKTHAKVNPSPSLIVRSIVRRSERQDTPIQTHMQLHPHPVGRKAELCKLRAHRDSRATVSMSSNYCEKHNSGSRRASLCVPAYASSAASDDSSEMSPAPAAPRQEQTQACPDRSSTHLTFLERWRDTRRIIILSAHVTPGRPTSRRQRCLTHFGAAPTNNPHPPINLETSPVTTDRRGTPPSLYQH